MVENFQRRADASTDLQVIGNTRPTHRLQVDTNEQSCTALRNARADIAVKIANVLNKLPKSIQKNAKADRIEIWNAPGPGRVEAALGVFAKKYQAKYQRAVICLTKVRDALLVFFDFPVEHW